jgi:hypothetical protein
MSTLLVAAIIVAFTVIPPVLFVRFTKRKAEKRRAKDFALLKNHGNDQGLSFTYEQVLKGSMLGLDLHSSKLLVLHTDGEPRSEVFDLETVKSCTVFREYDAVRIYDTKAARTEQVLARIGLKLEFSSSQSPVHIHLYNSQLNGIYEMADLEKKATEWKELIAGQTSRANKLRRA